MDLTVLSVGGSIIAPEKVDSVFLKAFREAIVKYLEENKEAKLILVCGGGAPARIYQEAYRAVRGNQDTGAQDWLGIKATHLNGEIMRAVFSDYTSDEVVTDPTADIGFEGRILVAEAWIQHRHRCSISCTPFRWKEGRKPFQHQESIYRRPKEELGCKAFGFNKLERFQKDGWL